MLTSSAGVVQPRMVAAIERLIDAEIEPALRARRRARRDLAYAIVRLAEAFLYNDAIIGIRGDAARLRQVEAALLGVEPRRRRFDLMCRSMTTSRVEEQRWPNGGRIPRRRE